MRQDCDLCSGVKDSVESSGYYLAIESVSWVLFFVYPIRT